MISVKLHCKVYTTGYWTVKLNHIIVEQTHKRNNPQNKQAPINYDNIEDNSQYIIKKARKKK